MASTGKPRRSFRWSVVVVPLGVLAVVAVAALLVIRPFGRTNGGSDYLTEAVALGDLEKSISSSGKLEAGLTTAVNPKVPGEVSSVSVRMGERVKRGDPLFTISKDDLSAAYNMANQKLKAAKAQVNAAKSSLKVAQATVVQSVDEVLASGSGGTNNTSGSGGVGDTDGTGTGGLTPPTSAEVRAAERQVAQQRANKDRAIAAAKAEIANANANLTNARNDYDNALDALGESIVAAPADGIVTAVNIAKGDTVSGGSSGAGGNSATGNPGGGSGTAAVEISSYSDAMLVAIDVTEAEVDSVKVGMDAEVTFDAFPELTAEGKVTAVAPTGTASGGLVMFSVTVELADPDARLRPGMNATGKIILDTAKNVLLVPNTALQGDQRGGYFVRVVARSGNAAQPEPQKVALGLANDSYSEVVSGLREGDVVVTGRVSDSLSGGGGIMGNRMMDGGSGPTIRRRSDPEPSNSGRGATGQEPPRGDK